MIESPRTVDFVPTPIGRLALIVDAEGRLRASGFVEQHARMEHALASEAISGGAHPSEASVAVARYFAGELDALAGIPFVVEGTPFQRAVWTALAEIPRGETRSYGCIARRIGRPSAVRAVGLANGANPIGLVLPCHRVIGADGSLTGYGGGVERKRWLLAHERAQTPSGARAR